MRTDKLSFEINKDLKRTAVGHEKYKIDFNTGENPLFNVLNAYAHFDPEINYCQGMNFVTALLLKHLEYEEDAFFTLVHVMKVHGWRGCFSTGMEKLKEFVGFFECVIETAFPEIHQKIKEQIDDDMVPIFSSIV